MAPVRAVLASIPSPPTGVYHVGPLTIHMYGVMLLVAIAACIWLTGVRWVRWGGDWDLIFRVAIWGVIFGIVGARIYHLITSWDQDAAIHGPSGAEVFRSISSCGTSSSVSFTPDFKNSRN